MTKLRCFTDLILFGSLISLGCSSTPQPKTTVPPASAAPPTEHDQLPPPALSAPTTTQVHIDDAILKACGIKADKAFFPFDSAKLEPYDDGTLSNVAKCFISGPLKGKSLKLIGRADPRGEHEYNMVLGQSRADTVGSFLKGKGIEKTRLNSSSRGAMDATGIDDPGWARDRRVDILLGT
jgi:peptidoglycan-associated lipoprotein